MVRQAHHERNQQFTVRPELVEGLIQRFPSHSTSLGLDAGRFQLLRPFRHVALCKRGELLGCRGTHFEAEPLKMRALLRHSQNSHGFGVKLGHDRCRRFRRHENAITIVYFVSRQNNKDCADEYRLFE